MPAEVKVVDRDLSDSRGVAHAATYRGVIFDASSPLSLRRRPSGNCLLSGGLHMMVPSPTSTLTGIHRLSPCYVGDAKKYYVQFDY